jgi:hypothetical protein
LKKPSFKTFKISGISNWNKARVQKKKEKEERERQSETRTVKLITFIVTLIAMALGMSFLPLFPQPLPIFLAFLVAFVTYQKPRIGMPIGGFVIGMGLLFHLAQLYFISFLGDTVARVVFIVVWMTLFVAMPLLFNRYRSALAVDFGILAFVCLFFEPTYFLAIPLILASAVFFKKYVGLTAVYYVLLSVPLQLMQYYQYTVLPIVQDDWWTVNGSAPPLFVSLTSISNDLTSSMSQFRLYDTSKVIYDIAGQTTWVPDWQGRTIGNALAQYLDSIPGILMFVVIVVGLALAMIFFSRLLVKEGLIGRGDRFFPCFTATLAAALFFVLLSALQVPLAFTADVSATTMVMGVFGTLLLTLPVIFMDFTPKQQASNQEIIDKAQSLQNKVLAFQEQLDNVKGTIPVIVTSVDGKTLVLKDTVDDILKRATLREFEPSELDDRFTELDKLGKNREAIEAELNTILYEYLIFSNGEFTSWVGKLKAAGLDIKATVKVDYQNDMPLEQRIEAIKQVVAAGRELTKEVSAIADPIYGIIRPLYDPSLPQKSKAVEFAAEKLEGKEAPWIAIEALYNALNNWARQYGQDIKTTSPLLLNSLKPIANLSHQSEVLAAAFGDNTVKVLGYAKKAEGMKHLAEKRAEKERLDMLDIIVLKDDVLSFLDISNDILTMLYTGLVADEEAIDRLLPTKDYLWEKNSSLRERLEKATAMLSDPSGYRINEIMTNLPKYLAYVDEAVQTLAVYSERKEFLLNYPLAEAAITEQLKEKKHLLPSDLPFRPQFAAEYLRLYYTTRYGEYAFDKENLVLSKRPRPL